MDWKKHFDQIYCIHYLPNAGKRPRLLAELRRVGILDSGIFQMRYTTPSPYDEVIWEKEKSKMAPRPCFVNICLEIRKCLAESVALGYKRLLLLEDDVCFLRDLDELQKLLDASPKGYGIVQYDKFVNNGVVSDYQDRLKNRLVNEHYFDGHGGFYTSAACVGIFDDGVREMLRVMDEHICATDIAYQLMKCNYAVAVKNLAVQVFYNGSNSVDVDGIDYMHQVYKNSDVDYSEYAVPDGYGYGKAIEMESEKKFKVSVYAIAKDEERVAERWYNCFKEADEVCVLVNNSTDRTAEILRGLGAKVVEKTYDKFRFDVARNEAMKICSPDSTLLFCTDMDDMVEPGWRAKVERAWELGVQSGKNPNSILFTYAVEYDNNGGKQKQTFLRHSIHSPTGWYWKSRIHEYLEHTTRKEFIYFPKLEVTSRPTKCEHGSYLRLLEEECGEPNCEARNMHLLGREYLTNKKYDEAIEWLNKYLAHPGAVWKAERGATMKFLSKSYGALGFENAKELWLWKAMFENPKDRDAPYLIGMILIQKKQWHEAVDVLEKCVAIEKPELDYPFFSLDAWTEKPWISLAEARFYVGDWKGATAALDKALEINPNSDLGRRFKDEFNRVMNSGAKPNLPPPEIPRERIEIPELM